MAEAVVTVVPELAAALVLVPVVPEVTAAEVTATCS